LPFVAAPAPCRGKSFSKTKNPRLTGNRGFLENLFFRLEHSSHAAKAPDAAMPNGHARTGFGALQLRCVRVFHFLSRERNTISPSVSKDISRKRRNRHGLWNFGRELPARGPVAAAFTVDESVETRAGREFLSGPARLRRRSFRALSRARTRRIFEPHECERQNDLAHGHLRLVRHEGLHPR
jgi:hypothetical protein